MKLLLEFDVFADLIDVPQYVVDNCEQYRNKFLDWIYSPMIRKRFCKRAIDQSGNEFGAVVYSGITFVDWLNTKVLKQSDCKARVLVHNICSNDRLLCDEVRSIFF